MPPFRVYVALRSHLSDVHGECTQFQGIKFISISNLCSADNETL